MFRPFQHAHTLASPQLKIGSTPNQEFVWIIDWLLVAGSVYHFMPALIVPNRAIGRFVACTIPTPAPHSWCEVFLFFYFAIDAASLARSCRTPTPASKPFLIHLCTPPFSARHRFGICWASKHGRRAPVLWVISQTFPRYHRGTAAMPLCQGMHACMYVADRWCKSSGLETPLSSSRVARSGACPL